MVPYNEQTIDQFASVHKLGLLNILDLVGHLIFQYCTGIDAN